MEGYSVSESGKPMPPLSQIPLFSPPPPSSTSSMGNNNISRKRERERSLKMTQMYTQLQATVPGLFPKATREVIINETIGYIKELEKKKQKLEEVKESMKAVVEGKWMVPCTTTTTTTNRNCCSITVSVSTNVAFFGIQSLPQPGLITLIFKVFCKHQAEVLAANISVNQGKLILAITALVQNGDGNSIIIENIKREIMSL